MKSERGNWTLFESQRGVRAIRIRVIGVLNSVNQAKQAKMRLAQSGDARNVLLQHWSLEQVIQGEETRFEMNATGHENPRPRGTYQAEVPWPSLRVRRPL